MRLMPAVALGQFGGDEFARRTRDDLLVETRLQIVEQGAIAKDETRLEQRRADRHVGFGLAQAFVDRARGVADFLAQVPQDVEHRFDDLFGACGVCRSGSRKSRSMSDPGASRPRP